MTPHRFPIRVYFEDTDAGGVVYHASYFRFAERARTEALRDAGAPHAQLQASHGMIFVVRRIKIDYLRPASLDSLLVVETESLAIGGASITLRQRILMADSGGADNVLADMEIVLVCIHQDSLKAARIPPRWRDILTPGHQPGVAQGE